MNLLLFGPPGAGKGTQSSMLVERDEMAHISTGDLFRAAIKNDTALGVEAKKYMNRGELVPDAIVIGMVEEALESIGDGQGFVLDGFPRTVPQAEALANLLKLHKAEVDRAVFLDVDSEVVVRRMSGRRVCQSCGAVYHVESKPTEKEGICDACGGEVRQRDDDKEDAIRKRLELYSKETSPLREFYGDQGIMVGVDGLGSTEEVYGRIKEALKVAQ